MNFNFERKLELELVAPWHYFVTSCMTIKKYDIQNIIEIHSAKVVRLYQRRELNEKMKMFHNLIFVIALSFNKELELEKKIK
jgi:hypothetical protein